MKGQIVNKTTATPQYSNDFFYTVGKGAVLYIYHIILDYFGCNTAPFKFASFLLLTPLVKIFHFNKLSTRDDRNNYLYSIFNDTFLASIYFKVFVPYLTRGYFSFFPVLVSAVLIISEVLQYRIRDGTSTYKVLSTGRVQDTLLAPVICITFYYVSQNVDFIDHGMDTSKSFLVFVFMILNFDAFFGLSHYLSHVVPPLWQLHSLHHQYKKEHLNAFANFHSDLSDALIANIAVFVSAIVLIFGFGRYHTSFMDVLFAAVATHLKFADRQMHLMYFFEWDMIDIIFQKARMASFHAEHHHDSNVNYALFGIFSDEMVKKVLPIEALLEKEKRN